MRTRIIVSAVVLSIATVMVSSHPVRAAGQLFESWIGFDTGVYDGASAYYPSALAVADLDGDGDLDIAVANSFNFIAPKMSVLLNDGRGLFGPPALYGTTKSTEDVVAADFDGDGDVDLAVSNTGVNWEGTSVSVFRNAGNGSFGPAQDYPTVAGPIGLAAADFDGDGDVDLAVAGYGYLGQGATVALLMNNGDGTFAAPLSFAAGTSPNRLAAADLNADGRPDLVVANDAQLNVLLNNGAGGFASRKSYSTSQGSNIYPGLAVADLDKDGDFDILYGGGSPSVALFRNQGTGSFGSARLIAFSGITAGPAVALDAADVTGDGWLDILATHGVNAGYSVIPSTGTGAFARDVHYAAGEHPVDVRAVDADRDGDMDLLIANHFSLELTVHRNPGTGNFLPQQSYATTTGAMDMDAADIDGDGDRDVAISSFPISPPTSGDISVHRNSGTGAFSAPTVYHCSQTPMAVKLRDLDGDGRPDLLWCDHPNAPPYNFHTRMNLGDGTFGAATTVTVNTCGNGDVEAFDMDDDGDLDVFLSDYLGCAGGANDLVVYVSRNRGNGTFDPPSTLQFTLNPELIRHADLNADGHQDLIVSTNGIEVRLGNGDGTFGPSLAAATPWGPKAVTTADFNGDGHVDVATANWGGDEGESMSILLGHGDGTFDPFVRYAGGFSPNFGNTAGIGVADADSDGDLDVVVGNYGSNDFSVFLNDGAGTFAPQVRSGLGARPLDLAFADFTGDGVPDVAGVAGDNEFMSANALVLVKGLAQVVAAPEPASASQRLVVGIVSPNPFTTQTTLTFSLPKAGQVDVDVYDLQGRLVRALDHRLGAVGTHAVIWNGRDARGRPVAVGVYVMRLSAHGYTASRRVVTMR